MNKTERRQLIKNAILNLDKSAVVRGDKANSLPAVTLFYDKMTEKDKKDIINLCGSKYPGGDLVAFAGLSKKDGFVFTTEGFFATKNYFSTGMIIRKQIPMPVRYIRIRNIHQCGKYDKIDSPIFCCIAIKGENERIAAVPLYAAYITVVLNGILSAFEEANKPKVDIAQEFMNETFENVESEKKLKSEPVKEPEPVKAPEPEKAVIPKSKVRVICGGYDREEQSTVLLCEKLSQALEQRNNKAYEILEFTSTFEACKSLVWDTAPDYLLMYADAVSIMPEKIKEYLSVLKLSKKAKIIVFLDCIYADTEQTELTEAEITELFETYEYSESNIVFVKGNLDYINESIDLLIETLDRECIYYRHTLPFRMPVARAFHVKKDDRIIEIIRGCVTQGTVRLGDKILLADADGASAASVYMILDSENRDVDAAYPDTEVDLFLSNVPKEAVTKGKIAVNSTDGIKSGNRIIGKIYVCNKNEGGSFTPVYLGLTCTLTIGFAEHSAVVSKIFNEESISAGAFGTVEIQTDYQFAWEPGMSFTMTSEDKIIAKGIVMNDL